MRTFLKNNLFILVIFNLGNVFNYLFQIVAARGLTPENFGIFNSLNSLAMVVSAPIAVLPVIFSKYAAQYGPDDPGRIKSLLLKGLKVLGLWTAVATAIGFMALPLIKNYLHISSSVPVILIIITLAISLNRPILLGTLRGLKRFLAFGISSNILSMVRFLFAILLIWAFGYGVNGAILSGLIASLAPLIIGFWCLKDILKTPGDALPPGIFSEMCRYALPVFVSATMIKVLGNLDIVLVRHYCSAEEAGLYATAVILGRIALFLPRSLIDVLFPDAVKEQNEGIVKSNKLWATMWLTGLLGGGFACLCIFWPKMILGLLFGEKYVAAARLLQVTSAAMALLAMANVLFAYGQARSEFKFLWPLTAGAGLMIALIITFHDSALTIASILLLSVTIILVGTLVMRLFEDKKPGLP